MLLDVTIGGKNFKLVISSTGIPPSKFSVNYISRNNGDDDDGDDDNDKDAVIQLGNFNGSLYISKVVELIETNAISSKISDISNDTGFNSSKISKDQLERSVSSLDMYDVSYKKAVLPSMPISEEKSTKQEQRSRENDSFPQGILGKRSNPHRRVSFLNGIKDGAYKGDSVDLDVYSDHHKNQFKRSESIKNNIDFIKSDKNSENIDKEQIPIKLKRRSSSLRRRKSKPKDMNYSLILRSFNRKNSFYQKRMSPVLHNDDNEKNIEAIFESASLKHSSSDFDSEDTSITGADNIIKQISQPKERTFRNVNRLHLLCKGNKTKINRLRKVLHVSPSYASYQDESGKLPLHWIAQNEALYNRKRKGVKSFVNDLIKVYPDAIISLDDNNQIPFVAVIQSWVEEANVSIDMDLDKKSSHNVIQSDEKYDKVLLKVTLTSFVEWAFQMLSTHIDARSYGLFKSNSDNRILESKKKICENFCSLHNVLKIILLVDDDVIRSRILGMPLLQRNILCTDLVSDWLVVMLRSNKKYSRALDFFEMISNLAIQNALDLKTKPILSDKLEFITLRDKMFRHISQLPGLITSLTILDKPDISRACSTYAIQRVLDFLMVNTSLIGMKFFDLSLNILLIMSYNMHMKCLQDEFQYKNEIFHTPWPLIIWICLYFFLNNDLSSYLIMRSYIDFGKRYMKFWNFIETFSLVASLYTTISSLVRAHYGPSIVPSAIVAVTKGLLWLRFFSFLKGINMQLTTFVLSVTKIISNLRWFLVLLGSMCLMFADMILTLSDNELCSGIDPETDHTTIGDYCSQNFLRGFVRAYSIITGDIELDPYRVTPLITLLWALFTLFGVIILLNVLVAIVTDSYERSFVERYQLFGKIRLPLLARHEFVKSKVKFLINNHNFWLRCFCWACFVTALILFEISLLSAIQFIWIQPFANTGIFGLTSLLFGALANVSMIAVVKDITGHDKIFKNKLKYKWQQHIRKLFLKIIQTMTYGLLGINTEADYNVLEYENRKFDGWINYLKFSTEEIVMNSEFRVLSVMRDFESRLEKQGLMSKPQNY